MRRTSTHCSIGWTFEPEDDNGDIPVAYDFLITADAYPGEPAVMYDRNGDGYPGSPPSLDDIQVSLKTVHDANGSHSALLEPHRAEIEKRFQALIDDGVTSTHYERHRWGNVVARVWEFRRSNSLRMLIEDRLFEDAGEREQGTRDAYWDAKLDEARERGVA